MTKKIIRHPDWCDQQKCTATAAHMSGECHRGTPFTMTLPGLLSTITVTAELSMANAPWLTEPFIEIKWAGLLTDTWSPVTGTATIPANQIGELLQALSGLAASPVTDQQNEIAEDLARPAKAVDATSAPLTRRGGERPMSRVDTAIKAAAGVTVIGLAGIAGAISYSHMTELAHLHGETGWRGHMFALSVDGIEIVASLVLLADKRAGRRSGRLPWAALIAGTGASLAANMAVGGSDWIGRAVSGWPAFALLIAVKLLFGLLEHPARNTPTMDGQPSVPDGNRTIALGHSIARTDERPASDGEPSEPDARTDELGTGQEDPVRRTARPGRRKYRTGTVDEPSAGRTDRAALEAAARAVHATLADEGAPLTRDVLAVRLRDAGHTVSNSRASDLVKLLRANAPVVNGAAPTSAEDGAYEPDDTGGATEFGGTPAPVLRDMYSWTLSGGSWSAMTPRSPVVRSFGMRRWEVAAEERVNRNARRKARTNGVDPRRAATMIGVPNDRRWRPCCDRCAGVFVYELLEPIAGDAAF